jgi:hypothetical protein
MNAKILTTTTVNLGFATGLPSYTFNSVSRGSSLTKAWANGCKSYSNSSA